MEMKQLDRGALRLWFIRNALVCFLLLASLAVTLFFIDDAKIRLVVALSVGGVEFFAIALLLIYPYWKYQLYSYGYDEKRIVIECGVIFRRKIVIPICQIQDLHRFEGPIMMLFRLSGVEISTAGSNFHLACLKKEGADAMIDELERFLEARVEEAKNEAI